MLLYQLVKLVLPQMQHVVQCAQRAHLCLQFCNTFSMYTWRWIAVAFCMTFHSILDLTLKLLWMLSLLYSCRFSSSSSFSVLSPRIHASLRMHTMWIIQSDGWQACGKPSSLRLQAFPRCHASICWRPPLFLLILDIMEV